MKPYSSKNLLAELKQSMSDVEKLPKEMLDVLIHSDSTGILFQVAIQGDSDHHSYLINNSRPFIASMVVRQCEESLIYDYLYKNTKIHNAVLVSIAKRRNVDFNSIILSKVPKPMFGSDALDEIIRCKSEDNYDNILTILNSSTLFPRISYQGISNIISYVHEPHLDILVKQNKIRILNQIILLNIPKYLDILVESENSSVRRMVASMGRIENLEILINDSNSDVANEARYMLYESNMNLLSRTIE